MKKRRGHLADARCCAQDNDNYGAFSHILTWAQQLEDDLSQAREPSSLPELQALINRAEKAEARAQELTNKLKKVEELAREWVKAECPPSVSVFIYSRGVCGNAILLALGKS